MRFVLALFAASLITPVAFIAPAAAQQVSPMTGTTGTLPAGPSATAPTAGTTATAPTSPTTTGRTRAHHPRKTMQQRFDAANTTKDGKLTLDQAKSANMKRVVDHFDAIDTSKKGYVTVEDIRAYGRAQRAAKRAAAPK